jgi:hemolysin activation/secretion protein
MGSTLALAAHSAPLKGIVLLSASSQASPEGLQAQGIDASRVPMLNDPQVASRLSRFLGAPIDSKTLVAIRSELNAVLSERKAPFTLVTIPGQKADGGVVQFLIVQGQVASISVDGARWFAPETYRSVIRQQQGQPVNKGQLDEDVDWINSNPYRHATVVATPGKDPGSTELTIHAEDRRPWRVFAGVDNTGTNTTGYGRFNTGVEWGNAFGLGHIASYTFATDTDFNRFKSHTLSYVAPLQWRDTLSAVASYTTFDGNVPAPFALGGYSSELDLRYEHPLARWGEITQSVTAGLEIKRSNSNLLFSSVAVANNLTQVAQARGTYSATRPDTTGGTQLAAALVLSPGGVGSGNDDAAFQGTRFGAKAAYAYGTLSLERGTKLPAGFSLVNSMRAQASSTNLLGSEQLALGGYANVRGYRENEAFSDQGVVLRNELRGPTWRVSQGGQPDNLQPLAFFDYARGSDKFAVPGIASTHELAGWGVGARYAWAKTLTLRVDWGIPLHKTATSSSGRLNFAAVVNY